MKYTCSLIMGACCGFLISHSLFTGHLFCGVMGIIIIGVYSIRVLLEE